MNIRIDDRHTLNSNGFCCWITTDVVSKNGEVKQKRISGYRSTVEDTLASYAGREFLSSEAQSVIELEKDVRKLKQRIAKWKKIVDKIGDAE